VISTGTASSTLDTLDKPLPHDAQAERCILGAILVDNACLEAIQSQVTPSDFFVDAYRRIFKEMQGLRANRVPIDFVTLHQALLDDATVAQAGGAAFISGLADGMPKIAPASEWARIVRRSSVLRGIAHTGQAAAFEALESRVDPEEILNNVQNRLTALRSLLSPNIPGLLASEVEIERTEWVWDSRIPLGKVTVLDGDPGLGKSAITLDLAARVSTGTDMPDDSPGVKGGVLILSAEDGEADTIVPRLVAMGANLESIRILKAVLGAGGERPLEIPTDLSSIERAARSVDARLIIVDPLMAFLSGNTNSYRDQDVRRALAPIATMSQALRVATLIVRHLNKATDGNPLYRGGGSIGIIGAARCGLLVARDPDDETGAKRVLAVSKTNLGPLAPSLSYFIEPHEGSIRVHWGGVSPHLASTLLIPAVDMESGSSMHEACEFLKATIESGSMSSKEVLRKAKSAGFSERTMNRAKKSLGIKARKEGFGRNSSWIWELIPDQD